MVNSDDLYTSVETFEVKSIEVGCRICDPDIAIRGNVYKDLVRQELVYNLSAAVAQGTQNHISTETETIDSLVAYVPATAVDWLKGLVVQFEPTLDFGWLKPQIIEKTIPTQQVIKKTFWNVYPLAECDLNHEDYWLNKIDWLTSYPDCWPSKIDWLTSYPPSDKQLQDAQMQARKNAWYMVNRVKL